jgi:hypothetical protein
VVPCFARTPQPNPRLSARSIWSWHAGTQKPTITRRDTYALASSLASPRRQELPPPPDRWLHDAVQFSAGQSSERCFTSSYNERRHPCYLGSSDSDSSDNVSEFSDSSEAVSEADLLDPMGKIRLWSVTSSERDA